MEFAYIQDHWAHQPKWIIHESTGADWFGFDAVRILETPEADFYFYRAIPGDTAVWLSANQEIGFSTAEMPLLHFTVGQISIIGAPLPTC